MFAFIFFSVYFLLLFSTINFLIVEFDIDIQFSMDFTYFRDFLVYGA